MTRNLPIQKFGNVERRTFAKTVEVQPMPYLIEIQRDSYNAFIEEGISEVFEDYSPITDYSDRFELYFLDHSLSDKPKYEEKECRDRDATYAVQLKVKVRLVNKVTGEIIDQDVFMGDLPKMTENGSFIINGAERVIVSQLVRSPGVYNGFEYSKSGKKMFNTTVIPNRGAWLEFEQDSDNVLWVKVDRTRKLTASLLLRALGFGTNDQINAVFENDPMMNDTMAKDVAQTESEGLYELYRRIRPGEVPTEDAVRQQLKNLFYDPRRYDCAKVGRYKFNKRLNMGVRAVGCTAYEDIVSEDGELIVKQGEVISAEQAKLIQNSGINEIYVRVDGDKKHKIIANNAVEFKAITGIDHHVFGLTENIHYPDYKFEKQLAEEAKTGDINAIADKYADAINDIFYVEESGVAEEEQKPEEQKNAEKRVELRRRFVFSCRALFDILEGEPVEKLTAEQKKNVKLALDKLNHKHITVDDIIATVSLNLDLNYGIGTVDNIDHLGNRRVRSVGELLQNQFRIGISRLERVIKERMSTQDPKDVSPSGLINVRPVSSAIKEFFGSSQLSQFMDQTNPIAELTHKRKLSALGPGGLNRERATFEVRDVHYTHYGRMCPIETPEGQNIGLITSLSAYAKVNEYGFIESAYRRIDKQTGKVTDIVDYLTADREDAFIIAQANEPLDEEGRFIHARVACRRRDEITELPKEEIDYMDVSPKQLVSVATALIPFLENCDTNRALMGSNMQRQAVPLLKPEPAIVGTGIEAKIAYDSGVLVIAKNDGVVKFVSGSEIIVTEDDGTTGGYDRVYTLKKFERSNQGTCLNQHPIVSTGDKVKKGAILADGPATCDGELSLGRNILIGFMTWEGYNYEDAILLSEKLVQNDVFTSIHIEEHEIECRETRLGEEEITRDIPNIGDDALKDLDENGVIRIGAEVTSGDILVGKVTPKGETELTPEERLLRAIFGEKAREVRDSSLRVPHGEGGIVVDVKKFSRANKDELSPGVSELYRVYIAQKRKISVGDKMAGRYGNKGVISRILPEADMPFLADGTPLQIVLNPLGVPSRMNIGQVLEVHLSLVCKQLGWKIATPVFDGASETDIRELLEENHFVNPYGEVDGKIQLYDGRTGEPFEHRVTVGYMYMIKLHHLVDDKIHARSVGPYSVVTQQPLGGKAQFGGQRFGEMEVWALEAYGASHILQEILTVKSDDVVGRVKTYESIVKGNDISEPGIPESFKVLLKELQSLALDMKVLTENHEEINLKDLTEEPDDYMPLERKERVDYVDLDMNRGNEDEAAEEDDSIFEDFDDTTTTVEEDEDFKSNELFDDFDDLDDLDEDDGDGDEDDE
ncbi:MAG: DNA-directed RNA polymerase subunit beta [Clostridia bacterium]|nr:DNA-directed RNA polymerase subunit beta [Clostridia bacterium]MDY3724790.1 DNA-directed RNA polymerase subunit beta [Christensenellaceae bacterium]